MGLKDNRRLIDKELTTIEARRSISPALYALSQFLNKEINAHVRGKVLDAGCGEMPYKDIIKSKAQVYETLDMEPRAPGVTYVGSLQQMPMVASNDYDAVFCAEVLEHVPDPLKAVGEVSRVLKKGGVFLLSVPHLSRLHEIPHDYYRYTPYGIRYMLEQNGFDIVALYPTGTLLTFFGHQYSLLINCLFWNVPGLKWVVKAVNFWCCVLPCFYLDRLFAQKSLFPLGHICVARKR